jgi:hypothetical protein
MKTKKILILLVSMLFAICVDANALIVTPNDNEITFQWEQSQEDLANLAGWRLYWADTETGEYVNVLDENDQPITIAYDPAGAGCTPENPCVATQPFMVGGPPGGKYAKYFKMTALDKEGYESELSEPAIDENGQAAVWFHNPLGKPFAVKVKIQRKNQ